MIKEVQLFIPFLKELRKKILQIYNSDFKHEIKEDHSPLTQADLLAHEEIVKFLKENFPQDGIISEEDETSAINTSSSIWIIDPIDGTKDFIKKTGEFSIMIGLLKNNFPSFGLVYLPVDGCFYFAKKNEGAYKLKGEKLTKLSINKKEEITLIVSRNNFKEQDRKIVETMEISHFEPMGSIGIKFSSIAQGQANLCFYSTPGLGIWDALPSHVILKEAGGQIFDRNGNELIYDLEGRKMLEGVIGCSNLEIKEKFLKAYQNIK